MRTYSTGRPTATSVAVIGTGYVGLTAAACLARLGNSVVAIDIDEAKVAQLGQGQVTIRETGLEELVLEGLSQGRLDFSTDYRRCAEADVALLCLPTPHTESSGPDLSAVAAAARSLGPVLRPGTVVVTKSTVPVGTQRQLVGWLSRPDVEVVSNPEFLREGTAVGDFFAPDRIVIGAESQAAADKVAKLYTGITGEVVVTDPTSAELVKYAANTFLAAKISFINEMSRLCDRLGADISAVRHGVGSDSRIGPAFLNPGPGWGGSCFPKDTQGLCHIARNAGQHLPIVEAAFSSNIDHLAHIVAEIDRLCPVPLPQAKIAAWGATFKAGTDDVRDSPALDIISRLQSEGAALSVSDPAADLGAIGLDGSADVYEACRDADMALVLTEWPEFATVDLSRVAQLMTGKIIYDTRYLLDHQDAQQAGLILQQPGRIR